MRIKICLAISLGTGLVAHAAHAARLEHARVWTFAQGGEVANLVAYDAERSRVYAGGGRTLYALDMATGVPLPVGPIAVDAADSLAITSVAAHGNLVAVSVAADPRTAPGRVRLYNAEGLDLAAEFIVGAGPDMLTFTPDGTRILVANEGEPDDAYQIDPEGSVSVIDVATRMVQTATFAAFNGQRQQLAEDGLRIFGPNATVAQDLEPEHIAARDDRAWVTLQENNALAMIALPRGAPPAVTAVVPLGFKNHGRDRNARWT
jgi:2',3'-cyclic-nucleotide 2'-phosphodiesterase / 3'-nucleotidase / 5'-nucleotidase